MEPSVREPRRRIILATADDGRFGQVALSRLADQGWDATVVNSADGLFASLGDGEAAAVLLDYSLPEADQVLARLKLEPETGEVPVVVLFPRGTAPLRPRSVRVQADLELSEPCEVGKLLEALARCAARGSAAGRTVRFLVPSCSEGLAGASDLLAELLRGLGLGEEAQTSFLAACREAVANAIEHGNKAEATRVVQVACHADASAIMVEVRDEGEGFDADAYLAKARELDPAEAARDRNRQGGRGGLGIMMMFRFTDALRYNDSGNAVTLVKNLKGARP